MAIALVAMMSGGGSSSGLPSGTQVFAESDHTHTQAHVTYDHDPPAGGAHNPIPLNCGVYTQPVPNENAVHSLEHGAVWITYQPSLDSSQVDELTHIAVSHYQGQQRYVVLSPYPGLPAPIVATAWGAQLRLQLPSDPRLGQFLDHYVGGNQGGEQGAPCSGGVGQPDQ